MKRFSLICFINGGDGGYELLNNIYDKVKHEFYKPLAKKFAYSGRGQLRLPLEENSKNYKYVMEVAKKYNLHYTIFQIVYYTKSEIDKAKYFFMRISSPLELEGSQASDYGTQYIGGCPSCGLGGRPVSDVLVDRKFMKKRSLGTLQPDVFVSKDLKELIVENKLTGVSFDHEVKDFKGREMSHYFVVDIPKVLPPMSESTWLIQDPYPDQRYEKCGHQVVYLRSDIQYEKEKLIGMQDFNLTKEFVNNYRLRQIVVSSKVRNLFLQNKVNAAFTPVAIL